MPNENDVFSMFQSPPEITVVLVNWFGAERIEQLINNLNQKALHPDKLQFLIVDNTNGDDASLVTLATLPVAIDLLPYSPGNLKGSRAHAAGLNYAMGQLKTPYTLVCDPDIYIFKHNWDDFLVTLLRSTNAVAAGVPFPDWKTGKYHDFPSPPFCFFDTPRLKELCTDWSPFDDRSTDRIEKFLLRQIGRIGQLVSRYSYEHFGYIRLYSRLAEKVLGIFAPDTGWKIARAARIKGVKSIVFDGMLPDQLIRKSQPISEAFIELARYYELFFFKEQPFMVHQYGSQRIPWKTRRGNDSTYWNERILQAESNSIKELLV